MRKYKSYHTILKTLIQKGSLPDYYLVEINRSTIWRWKQESGNKYIGHELSKLEVLENFINRKEADKLMRVYLKAALSIGSVLNTCKLFHQGLNNNKTKLVKLIINGGPENNNKDVDGFIQAESVNIIKLIALKDVPFSNSVVEAQNKLLKYRYLFKNQVQDINELRSSLQWMVDDYNQNRPHIPLNGLTPYEAYNGIIIDKNQLMEQIRQAKIDRLAENKKLLCETCN